MSLFKFILIVIFSSLLISCAGPNPNPGERVTDVMRNKGNFAKSLEFAKKNADKGYPWAQLRMGLMYEKGLGVQKDSDTALSWYEKVSVQKASGDWANGKMIGASGKSGFFNQNSDALAAQFQLSKLYFERNKGRDRISAYVNIMTVKKESKGQPIFFCCEFAEGFSIPPKDVENMFLKIKGALTASELKQAEEEFSKLN